MNKDQNIARAKKWAKRERFFLDASIFYIFINITVPIPFINGTILITALAILAGSSEMTSTIAETGMSPTEKIPNPQKIFGKGIVILSLPILAWLFCCSLIIFHWFP